MATTNKNVSGEKKAAGKVSAGGAIKTVRVPALSVTSKRDGFRRAGRVWGKEAIVIKLSDLTSEQVRQLKGEALLSVTEVEVDEEAAE